MEAIVDDSAMKQQRSMRTILFVIFAMGMALISWLASAALAFAPLLFIVLRQSGLKYPILESVGQGLPSDYRAMIVSGILLVASFLLLYITGFFFLNIAGWLVLRNMPWWTDAGCPECGERELIGTRQKRLDQFVGRFMTLPLGRHACQQCDWEGLRLVRGRVRWRTASAPVTTGQSIAPVARPLQPASIGSSAIRAPSRQPRPIASFGQGLAVSTAAVSQTASFMTAAAAADVGRGEIALDHGLQIETFLEYAERPFAVAIAYLVALTVAESIAVLFAPTVGATLHVLILFLLIMHAGFTWDKPIHRFLLALTLVPLIRVISLSLPLVDFSLSYWFLITSIPLFAAAYVIMRQLNFTWRDVGLRRSSLPLQLLIGLTGILFGITEYFILKPDPLIDTLSWQQIWLPAAILLISTGFLEEYIFRFLMQRTSVERLGRLLGIVYVALFFAVLHIGYRSVIDFLFVLVVGLFFGLMAGRTRSIVGVTISHGLTNIMLFLIVPLIVLGIGVSPIDKAKSLLDGGANDTPAVTLPEAAITAPGEGAAGEVTSPAAAQQTSQPGSARILLEEPVDGDQAINGGGFTIVDYAPGTKP